MNFLAQSIVYPDMDIENMSDDELEASLKRLVREERESTVAVLKHLAELDKRNIAIDRAFPSLFMYCVEELGYAENAAYRRIRAARAGKKFPRIHELLGEGKITLTAVSMLAPHLTLKNHISILRQASGLKRGALEAFVSTLAPKIEPRESIRFLGPRPVPAPVTAPLMEFPIVEPAERPPAPAPPPPSPLRVHFSFTADETLHQKIQRAREILWHKYPFGRLEDIIDAAMEALLDKKDRDRWIRNPHRRKAH